MKIKRMFYAVIGFAAVAIGQRALRRKARKAFRLS